MEDVEDVEDAEDLMGKHSVDRLRVIHNVIAHEALRGTCESSQI